MSKDTLRQRIDWNGEGHAPEAIRTSGARGLARKAKVPAAIGLAALALIGALAAGPLMRGLAGGEDGAAVAEAPAPSQPPEAADDLVAAAETAPAEQSPATVAAAPEPQGVTQAKPAARSAGLDADDPRWNAAELTVDEDKLSALKAAVAETVAAAEIAGAMGNTEGLTTSGIPTSAAGFAPERPAAARERSAFDAALVTQDDADASASEPEVETVSSSLSQAKATQYVNMRAGPDDGAAVLAVVPANATIQAESDCQWCEVNYDGKTGYIYRSFISRN